MSDAKVKYPFDVYGKTIRKGCRVIVMTSPYRGPAYMERGTVLEVKPFNQPTREYGPDPVRLLIQPDPPRSGKKREPYHIQSKFSERVIVLGKD